MSADAEEVNLAQILLRVPENATPQRLDETRQRADDLVAQLKGGADFARLAASYSNAAEALQGGELGWRSTDRLPTLFIDAIKGVKTGDIAPIVRSPNGFHILKVLGRRSAVAGKLAGAPGAADARPPHPAAGHRRHTRARRQAPPGGVQGAHRGRADRVRHARAPALRRPERQPRRRPRLGLPRRHGARVRARDERAQDRRGQRAGAVALRLAPDPGHRAPHRAGLDRACAPGRPARRCASARADEAYQDWLRQLRDKTYVEYRLEERS